MNQSPGTVLSALQQLVTAPLHSRVSSHAFYISSSAKYHWKDADEMAHQCSFWLQRNQSVINEWSIWSNKFSLLLLCCIFHSIKQYTESYMKIELNGERIINYTDKNTRSNGREYTMFFFITILYFWIRLDILIRIWTLRLRLLLE